MLVCVVLMVVALVGIVHMGVVLVVVALVGIVHVSRLVTMVFMLVALVYVMLVSVVFMLVAFMNVVWHLYLLVTSNWADCIATTIIAEMKGIDKL